MAGKEREELRREETIRALWASIARSGIEGTTMEAVASTAGFSKGVIHYWFASKKELLLAGFEAFLDSYDREIEARLAALGHEPSWMDALDAIVDAILPPYSPADAEAADLPLLAPNEFLSPRYKARLFIQFFAQAINDPDFGAVVARSYRRQGEGIAGCLAGLEPGLEAGRVSAQAAAFIALVDGFSLHRVVGYRNQDLPDHGELARAWLRDTIAAATKLEDGR